MLFYKLLSNIRFLKSYNSKIISVALLSANLPWLTLALMLVTHKSDIAADFRWQLLASLALESLVGTTITFLALRSLLKPVQVTAEALSHYQATNQLPKLPTKYTDAAGTLMAGATQIIGKLDGLVRHLEYHDEVTGLANRKLFQMNLEEQIVRLHAAQVISVFVIDIDGFKGVNTVENDEFGNRLLQAVGERLSAHFRQVGFVARLGNDEFALSIVELNDNEQSFAVVQNILNLLSQPFDNLGSKSHCITASVGACSYPTDGKNAAQLIANAYAGLEQAKLRGCNNYQFFYADISTSLHKQLKLENDLKVALEKDQLFLQYQPRVDSRTGRIKGVEGLVRWRHPELGFIPPNDFIGIAERTGDIFSIGEWILKTACQQNKAWQQAGLPPIRVAVNLSARQIEQPGLVNLVQNTLAETNLSADFLELEVTESLMMKNVSSSLSALTQLHQLGITLSLDDFGTGYSSLSYLRRFPFDTLKIDRAFTQDLLSSVEATKVTQAITSLAKGLGMGVVAEGVETEDQLEAIEGYGCYEIQGYYFSKPLLPEHITALLEKPHPFKPSKQDVQELSSSYEPKPQLSTHEQSTVTSVAV